MSDTLQVWVRNDKGQVYGPLSPPSVELLIDNGIIGGRLQVSTNGENYVYPGRVPGLRMIFPKETWGDTVVPGEQLDAEWARVAMPAAMSAQASSPSGLSRAPVAGPGARAPAGGPVAGPGARQQPTQRPMNPAQLSRPSGVIPAAPFKSSPSVTDFMTAPLGSAAPASAVPVRSSPSVAPVAAPVPSSPSVAAFVAPPVVAAPKPKPVAAPPPPGEGAMPASGSLDQYSAQRLYFLAGVGEHTGLLTLKLHDRELVVHFKRGNPEFLDSTHLDDTLDTFLVQQRLATTAQIQQALAQASRFGGELLPALFGLGLLNPNAVFQHLGQRAATLLMRVLTAEQGTFTFDVEELPASRAMPLGNRWAVYLEALRKLPQPDLRRRLARAWDLPIMKAGGRLSVGDVRLTPQETRALNYFDGVRSLAQLARDLPAEAEVISRTALMLLPLDLVSFADVQVRSSPTPAPQAAPRITAPPPPVVTRPSVSAQPAAPAIAPPPSAAAPTIAPPRVAPPTNPAAPAAAPVRPPPPVMAPVAAKPASPYPGGAPPVMRAPVTSSPSGIAATPVPVLDAKQLQELLLKLKKQTFFDVLGLKKDADANAVKAAYLKAARSYHPDTIAPGSPEALVKAKADMFALIVEANNTLSDADKKAEYLAELAAGGTGSKVDVEKIFRAEDSFQKGMILVKARKYPEAVKMLESAIADNADEGEFYAWRGYAKFLAASDRKAVLSDVMKDLNTCVAKTPNAANVYYFLGFVAKTNGDTKTALTNFKKCVALDAKHIDAARELRTLK